MLEHDFNGPAFTVGIEEELMLLDADGLDLAQGIEQVLAGVPPEREGQVKPELMQSVLEVATRPCPDVRCAGEELRALRRMVSAIAERNGMLIGAAGTHPFALYEEQLIVDRPRYLEIAEQLGWIAQRELIFGTHVHVGMEGADRAIYVADGIRRYLPLMLGLSTNSPFWRGRATRLMSSRVPIFRAFPRNGIPPHYGTWQIYSHRVEQMTRAGAIEDYTYLWWDVRPHPNLGTVETRVFDQQTRIEHTISLAALTVALARRFARLHDAGEPLVEHPTELVDDNKVRAAIVGMEGQLVDFRAGRQVPAPELARGLLALLSEDADALGCRTEMDGVADLLEHGTGARRQLRMHERSGDMTGLVREIVERSRA